MLPPVKLGFKLLLLHRLAVKGGKLLHGRVVHQDWWRGLGTPRFLDLEAKA